MSHIRYDWIWHGIRSREDYLANIVSLYNTFQMYNTNNINGLVSLSSSLSGDASKAEIYDIIVIFSSDVTGCLLCRSLASKEGYTGDHLTENGSFQTCSSICT